MWNLLAPLLGFLGKILPFLGAYKYGKDKAAKEQAEDVLEKVEAASKIDNSGEPIGVVLDRLHKNK